MSVLPSLYLSRDTALDWLTALEFGRVDDGQPPDCWSGVTDQLGFLHDSPGGRVVGFKVLQFSTFDPETLDDEAVWGEPRFDAPGLGLLNASAGEIVLAARRHFGTRHSLNRMMFNAATDLEGIEALQFWQNCLESGDGMAHFGLGYTLYGLGRYAEAYRHLRHYTEIAPHGSWNWCWYGKAAEKLGEMAEARRAYRRAVELEEAGDQETDARELLERLPKPPTAAPPAASVPYVPAQRVLLWGDDFPEIGQRRVEGLSPTVSAGLTSGGRKKRYAHTDPNEDAVAVVDGPIARLLVCADGHNGMSSTRAAVGVVLDRLGGEVPDPATVTDDELVDLWDAAGKAVIEAASAAGQPASRTTLIVAILGNGKLRWAAMGDSLLAIVHPDETVRKLGKRRSHFVGWPMTRQEIAHRLQRGTETLPEGSWAVLATDGFGDFVPSINGALTEAIKGAPGSSRVIDRLIDAACAGGAGDNIAVVATQVGPVEVRTPVATPAPPRMSAMSEPEDPGLRLRIHGCLIGGAVGDSLGAPVEFDSMDRIRRRFGPSGITEPAAAYGHRGAITDDTQMTLFTAEGLIRAFVRIETKGLCHPATVVDHAYARWLATQGEQCQRWEASKDDGWLIGVSGLHDRRAPGNTCLSAMRAKRMGTVDEPLNDSKGCGGVMRVAPAGLVARRYDADKIFELGCDIAALTHGHPSGYLAAGALAEIISRICDGDPLDAALDSADRRLQARPRHEETLDALRGARALAASGAPPSPEVIATLGQGWVAEEALAISVYCSLVADDFAHGVRLAVNHSGDSDSTGAITGTILGTLLGYNEIPPGWIHGLELAEVVLQLCWDMSAIYGTDDPLEIDRGDEWWDRYPGW